MALFGITSFLASALLFVVEPLVARTLLPVLGGSASVWNSAMLTFQVLLLGGYLLAHLGARHLRLRWHPPAAAALVVAATIALPVGLREGWRPPAGTPVVWTLFAVAVAVGGPFLALASVSPTLQRWYGAVAPGVDAYVLYAAGNAGSFIGLLAYPLVVERVLGLSDQRAWWSAGYIAFAVLFVVCAAVARRAPGAGAPPPPVAPGAGVTTSRHLLRWAGMAAAPSLLLLGTTRHLSTDVAAIPLLWVVPLSVYLLTFVVAFSGRGRRPASAAGRLAPVLAAVAVVSLAAGLPVAPGLALHLGAFTMLAMAVHGRLAAERPPVEDHTRYYLALSAGGAAGGVVGGLIAPVVFPGVWEYPLGIVACLACVAPHAAIGRRWRPVAAGALAALLVGAAVARVMLADAAGPPRALQAILGLATVAALASCRRAWQFATALAVAGAIAVALPGAGTVRQLRTYYGVTRVLEDDRGWRLLVSGSTVHGAQDPARPRVPLTYYAPGGPLADVVTASDAGGPRSVGVIGLGAGSMAAYAEAGDQVTFYEIDPAVIELALDPRVFSFLADSAGTIRIVPGDGRLTIAAAGAGVHDLVVVDAFSSDAIPVHLVTREAVATYRRALSPGGMLAFHVSNRYFDLLPVVARLASDAGLIALGRTGAGTVDGSLLTSAVALGPEGPAMAALRATPGWREIPPGPALWTDDRSDVLGAL
jgi:SAM-dependent methyltransferase